ncbi:SEC-C domain-containing protein [Actinomycetospora sp. TBRC 11914]|uniref:SEC-C domain-containing protein n=1 Tax=Actinomycetospora sp. TBRC 11914 TaxID=2729387 RepID=UPI00145EB0A5|nr:SEC-C domain-containing protein [Actinomycetospora sp. TBRC 11914]NMO93177.1 SEC-C domain-containing protein [Actinomycetospora sp. TBRC 11914]
MATDLTEDDLTEIAHEALDTDDPGWAITELVAAVEEGRLADEADTSYAFGLAADLAEGARDGDRALALSRRAVDTAQNPSEENWSRGRHADLLMQFGHEDEGMRLLRELRPLLTRDGMATIYVVEALTENGHAELAVEWLTAALATASDIVERAEEDSDSAEEAQEIEYGLARKRRAVRRDLGLSPDELDLALDELDDDAPDIQTVFWPETAFGALLTAFPDRADVLGATWDEHRAQLERAFQEEGWLPVEVATPELLQAALADGDVIEVGAGPLLEWPPGRNDPCWCGSGTKYKKCCLPRAR